MVVNRKLTNKVLRQMTPKKQKTIPVARMGGQDLFLPNYSGIGEHTKKHSIDLKAKTLEFDTTIDTPTHKEGLLFYDKDNKTLAMYNNDSDVTLQIGQEQWLRALNNTGSTINNGSVVRINGASGENPTVSLAKADSPVTTDQIIGVATHNIEDNTIGIVTTFGAVRDIDTSGCSSGDILYLSADTAGAFTNTQPEYPNYIIKIGQCTISNAGVGIIHVNISGRIEDILENGWNGGFLETINFTTSSDGATITGSLENNDNTKNLTMNFSDGFTVLDTTTSPKTVTLTAGTDDNPQTNFVYILKSDKLLTSSTSDWPITEHIKVANIVLRTANTTQTDGALGNRNWNDHIAGTNSQGHIQHISEKLRQFEAQWDSGAEGSITINSVSDPDDVYVSNTAGKVYQLHLQDFPALDMATSDDIHVINNFANPYVTTNNLNTQTIDADGDTLVNRHFSFVVWGVINRTGEVSHLMLNLPTGSYTSSALAISDPNNYSVYTIPTAFKGMGFLIGRYTFNLSSAVSGTWTLNDSEDLRGFIPNSTAGGGAGGGAGVTTFTGLSDTPSTYTSNTLPKVNIGGTALEFSTYTDTQLNTLTDTSNADALHTHTSGIDHTLISNIGTNSHSNIDTHISDGTIHFTQAGISITASQVSDFDTEVANNTAVALNTDKISYTDGAAVALNTTHRSSDGKNHSDVVTNTSNIATNVTAIGLNTTHRSSDGKDHSDVVTNNAKVTNATHTGEVTGSGALTIADNVVDEANLKVNVPTNDYVLTAASGEAGGMKWAAAAGGVTDHADLTNVTANQHHNESHTVASHSDTTATGTELDTLTDNSFADTLHRHSELVAVDGSPDPVVNCDASGHTYLSNRLYFNNGQWIMYKDVGGTSRSCFALISTDDIVIGGGGTDDLRFEVAGKTGTSAPMWIEHTTGNIGMGTSTPATSAKLDITSTTGALIVPRMTTTQRNTLTAVNGMIIYNTTTNSFNFYENGTWKSGGGLT